MRRVRARSGRTKLPQTRTGLFGVQVQILLQHCDMVCDIKKEKEKEEKEGGKKERKEKRERDRSSNKIAPNTGGII
jgi:hypothetical protein